MFNRIKEGILTYIACSFINYGVYSFPRNRFMEIVKFVIRTAVAAGVMYFLFTGDNLSKGIKHAIGAVLVLGISVAVSYFAGKNPNIGGFTMRNLLVTLAGGYVATGLVFFALVGMPLDPALCIEMFLSILCLGGTLAWAIGFLKSFSLHMVQGVSLMCQDDGRVYTKHESYTLGKSILTGNYVMHDTSTYDSHWTLATYLYNARVIGLITRMVVGLCYALTVGIFLAGYGTLVSIVSVANPERPEGYYVENNPL